MKETNFTTKFSIHMYKCEEKRKKTKTKPNSIPIQNGGAFNLCNVIGK